MTTLVGVRPSHEDSEDERDAHPKGSEALRRMSTGSRALDSMLEGGIPFRRFTEFSGASGTGKSQLMFTVAVNFPPAFGRILFVDTGGTFRPERIHQIASLRSKAPDAVLANVEVLSARSAERMVDDVFAALDSRRYSALMVDSLSDLFYGGNEIPRETARLSLFCRRLAYSALTDGMLVVATNGVRYNPEANYTYAQGTDHTAAYIHNRISLRRNGSRWLAIDIISNAKAEFAIGPSGIVDV